MDVEWITPYQAGKIMGVVERTVQRSLSDARPNWRRAWWGEQGEHWTVRPTQRRMLLVSRERAEQIAKSPPPVPEG